MLQHIMKTASDAGNKQFEVLDRVAQNVANVNTTGYKVKRFEQYLRVDGQIDGADRVDHSQGSVMVTKRELDIAIKGQGFLPVTQPDGTIAFTRDGSFTKNSDGYLITQRGDLVGDGIQLPMNYEKLIITGTGEVQVRLAGKMEPQTVGQLKLVNFQNPEGLKSIGYNKLVATAESGPATVIPETKGIKQGCIERSNVNMFHQIEQILRLNAGVLSNMRVVKFTDDIYRQAVNLKQ
jgi:flagellar basal-body rod protein FlgG